MTAPGGAPATGHGVVRRRPGRRRPLVTAAALGVVLALTAACASGSEIGEGGQVSTGVAADRSLRDICPATVVVQTSWWPESTHGGIFQLLGTGYTVDKARKRVRGPLISQGADTGVQLEIRAGGGAVGDQPIGALMRTDPSITLGQQATEEQVQGWTAQQRTVAVLAPFDVDPVVFIYDRKQHPEFLTFGDIGQTDTEVVSYDSANLDFLIGGGKLRASQVDRKYDGSPSRLMTDRTIVVGGFATNEPFLYRKLGVDIDYFYVEDYPNYRNMLVVREDARQQLDPCLRRLVPALQQGMVDFMARPEPVLRLIVRLNELYGAPFPYSQEQARYGVGVMKKDNLVTNPAADSMRGAPFGALNRDRVAEMLTIMRPIYAERRTPIPAEATADALATNDYLDASIRLPNS